ncbi:MAG: zf-HC2 domain-containing protein [Candidatus Rokubacteria bacterium]|nr:zf-HC2 domain-containing protein [Candidatus Rokubacteria bacterium]
MTCRELVSAIDPYLDDELTVMETLRMQGHLLFCEACRQAIESEALLRSFVAADAAADEAPAALRERIRRRVALIPSTLPGRRSRPRRPVLSRALLAGLAMLGLVLGALVVLGVRDRDHISPPAAEVAAKHLLYGVPAEPTLELATSETVRMAAWLERRLGFSVKLPLLARPGERLVGGRVSSIADAPAAYLLYERNGRRISLLITQPVPSMHRGQASHVVEGVEFYTASLHGVALVWWEDTQRLYAAASTAGQKDLLEFALLCVRSGGQSRAMDRVS